MPTKILQKKSTDISPYLAQYVVQMVGIKLNRFICGPNH